MSLEIQITGQALLPAGERAGILRKIRSVKGEGQISVLFVTDAEIKTLNHKWRGKNKPTDVLSFSAQEGEPMPGLKGILGDVVISVDCAQTQAVEWGHEFADEIVVLFVHGFMHLMGYDHERGFKEANEQLKAEMKLLAQVGVEPKFTLCSRVINKIKMTRPRKLILAELRKQKTHISAEKLLALLHKENPLVSQATVYRTLKLFQESGIVKAHYFGDVEAVFELILEPDEHHDHLICEVCYRIVEFENHEIERQQEIVARKHEFRLTRHRMELYGICGNCE